MTQPTFGIGITADDKTAKGFTSAEKRAGKTSRKIAEDGKRWARETQSSVTRSSGGVVRTFGQVEQAGARLFGGRSMTSGITSRLGAIGEAAGSVSAGMSEAAGASGLLGSAIGGVSVMAAGAVGILAAAGYAAFKFADGWAKGAASIGRTAQTIGVSTKLLQEFTAAGERQGMDKGAAAGALGGLSQTLNDARYGKNNTAVAQLDYLGIKTEMNKDGTVNMDAMLPKIADAVSKRNANGQRSILKNLGLGLDALPLFAQGSKALGADMADADTHASVIDDAGIATGRRIARKGVLVGQLKDRGIALGGEKVASTVEGGYDAGIAGGKAIVDAEKGFLDGASRFFGGVTEFGTSVVNSFKPAAGKIEQGARAIERAAGVMLSAGGGAGRFSSREITSLARRAIPLAAEARRYGFSDAESKGIAANVILESGGNHRASERGGSGAGRGLIQWTDRRRKAEFQRVMGVDVEHSSRDQQWRFLRYELSHREAAGWSRAMANGQDAPSIAAGYARYVERPENKARDSAERAAVAEAMTVNLHVTGLPKGTAVRATAGRGKKPAVSHAFAH